MNSESEPKPTAPAEARDQNLVASLPEPSDPDMVETLTSRDERRYLLVRIIRAYESAIVRAYCRVRFTIIRQCFLDEIEQYLPKEGSILDAGCGFGLFGLYFAGTSPKRQLVGFDLNADRIAVACHAAAKVGITNAHFRCDDARSYVPGESCDAIYALDLVHHLPRAGVPEFLSKLHRRLSSSGVLILKDVNSRPAYKRWFTLALDRAMTGMRGPIYYWPVEELKCLLQRIGFRVYTHNMPDILPYPHMLYLCHK